MRPPLLPTLLLSSCLPSGMAMLEVHVGSRTDIEEVRVIDATDWNQRTPEDERFSVVLEHTPLPAHVLVPAGFHAVTASVGEFKGLEWVEVEPGTQRVVELQLTPPE